MGSQRKSGVTAGSRRLENAGHTTGSVRPVWCNLSIRYSCIRILIPPDIYILEILHMFVPSAWSRRWFLFDHFSLFGSCIVLSFMLVYRFIVCAYVSFHHISYISFLPYLVIDHLSSLNMYFLYYIFLCILSSHLLIYRFSCIYFCAFWFIALTHASFSHICFMCHFCHISTCIASSHLLILRIYHICTCIHIYPSCVLFRFRQRHMLTFIIPHSRFTRHWIECVKCFSGLCLLNQGKVACAYALSAGVSCQCKYVRVNLTDLFRIFYAVIFCRF